MSTGLAAETPPEPVGAPEQGDQLAPLDTPTPQQPQARTRDSTSSTKPQTGRTTELPDRGRRLWRRLQRLLDELHSVAAELPPELRQEISTALIASASQLDPSE